MEHKQFCTPSAPPIPSSPPPPIPLFPPPDMDSLETLFYVQQHAIPIPNSPQYSATPIVSPINIDSGVDTITATNVRVVGSLENVRNNVELSTISNDSENMLSTAAVMDVTDLDFLLRLGYEESNVKKALTITSGDKMAALYLLSRSMAGISGLLLFICSISMLSIFTSIGIELGKKEYSKWRKESDDDWISGVSKFGQPNLAINR